jgi:hypothetical protein
MAHHRRSKLVAEMQTYYRVLAPAGDLIQQGLAAQEWNQPVLRAKQRG